MHVPHMENFMCTAFDEYKEVLETVPHHFSKGDVTWVTSKLSDAAGALRTKAIELIN